MRQSRSNEHVQQKIKKNPFHSVKEDEILASFKKMEQFEKDEDLRSGKIISFHEKYLDQLMKREYVRGFRMAEVLLFEARYGSFRMDLCQMMESSGGIKTE